MLGIQTRRYSLIQISQHRSQKNQLKDTLNRIYSAEVPSRVRIEQDKPKVGPSYVSPSIQQINIFNSKRHHSPNPLTMTSNHPLHVLLPKKFPSKKHTLNIQKQQDSSIALQKPQTRNIREYFSRLSIEKRNKARQKQRTKVSSTQKEPERDKSSMLIVRRAEKEGRSSFAIHNTHLYYFSKRKRPQTESQTVQIPSYTSQRQSVTLSHLLQMRKQLAKQKNKQAKQPIIDESVLTNSVVAIIQVEDSLSVQPEAIEGQLRDIEVKDIGERISKEIKVKKVMNRTKSKNEEEEISPWKRRKTNQFDPY